MTDTPNRKSCPKCGGPVQGGYLDEAVFVVPGEPTEKSLVAAFKQGIQDQAPDHRFALRGLRCANCGFVEFHADEEIV
jgi:predicted nucleic-acid-binding Zn-ribbon protein